MTRVLVEYGLPQWKGYAVALVLGLVAAACTSSAAYLVGHGVDQMFETHDLSTTVLVCAVVVAVFAIKGSSLYGQSVISARLTNRITADGQRQIFDKLLCQDVAYFGNWHSSAFVNRVVYSAAAPGNILNIVVNSFGRDLVTVTGLLAVMLSQAPILSLASFLVVFPAMLLVRSLTKQAREAIDRHHASSLATMETVQETLQGLRTVKAFNLEGMMQRRISASIDASLAAANKMAEIKNRLGPLMDTLGGIVVASMFAYGAYRVIATGARPGEFVSFTAAFLLAYEPTKRLARFNLLVNKAVYDAELLFQVLDAEASEQEEPHRRSIRLDKGGIEFQNVSFCYDERDRVIRNLSFTAKPGEVTALVGPSGGGKTTILNLILRLHEVEAGRIEIDAEDVATVLRSSLRQQIGYIGQDVFLFRGSIRDNISAGKPGATEQEIVDAAKAAFAHDFIVAFPHGYGTLVGELGSKLSTGQRQRIAIARAMLKNSRLILLDEPTSSLDSESEREVDDAMRRLCKGRTTLVVAHRLHTIVHADCIHFVEDGAIVESGTHQALIQRKGRYADLFRLQFRGGYEASLKESGLPKLTEGHRQEQLHAARSHQSG